MEFLPIVLCDSCQPATVDFFIDQMYDTPEDPFVVQQGCNHHVIDLPYIHVVVNILTEPFITLAHLVDNYRPGLYGLTCQSGKTGVFDDVRFFQPEIFRDDTLVLIHDDWVDGMYNWVKGHNRLFSKQQSSEFELEKPRERDFNLLLQ